LVNRSPGQHDPLVSRRNLDERTVAGFGDEWSTFDQTAVSAGELDTIFRAYFAQFPWDELPPQAEGFDLGCGSGRWARLVAGRVGVLHCIDASPAALEVARRGLRDATNCRFHVASVDAIPLQDGSMDFGYSLGVLHHVPDTAGAIAAAARALKPGAPLLLYLYYALENRPWWYRALWQASDRARRVVAAMPHGAKLVGSTAIAAAVYLPLARGARALERRGRAVDALPLSFYRERSFYTMRTDAYDRFGTRLEQRFTADQIRAMMSAAGLRDISFSPEPPFWCAVGRRAGTASAGGR
jgi:ubiquinone/menaquinone biosynthesis C-methylase UbiE